MSTNMSINTAVTQSTPYIRQGSVTVAAGSEETGKVQRDSYQARGKTQTEEGVVYKPNSELVAQLKADLESQQLRFLNTVKDTLTKQGIAVAEGDGVWKQLASGNYKVDDKTRAAAQEAISEGGYWSVEKTSERLVAFAKALTGGDPSKAEAMREAFVKGFQAATKTWGKTLPDISQKTYDATMKLFDDWANEE